MIDLHRHLSGCIQPKTIHNILQRQGENIQLEEVYKLTTYKDDDKPKTFRNFLDKFQLMSRIKWTDSTLEYIINQVVWDIASEKIQHFEMKISIDKFLNFTTSQKIIKSIYDLFNRECSKWGITFGLVLALRYESDKEQQHTISKSLQSGAWNYLCGIDLVGNEEYFHSDFYEGLLKDWHAAKKGIQAHVGETQTAENVRYAIEKLNINRIAHGVSAAKYPDIMKLATERNICFDVAITSNILTGIVSSITEHPVKQMLDNGCLITIGTDDPATLNTTLEREYELLRTLVPDDEKIIEIKENSRRFAFKTV